MRVFSAALRPPQQVIGRCLNHTFKVKGRPLKILTGESYNLPLIWATLQNVTDIALNQILFAQILNVNLNSLFLRTDLAKN